MPSIPNIAPVVHLLDKAPSLMSQAVVFGSALTSPATARDLDVAIMANKSYEFGDLDKYRKLLSAGAYGTPRYGLFDLFVIFDNCVWVRNSDCLGFERSKNVRAIRSAIKEQAQPWCQWRDQVKELFSVDATGPTQSGSRPKTNM